MFPRFIDTHAHVHFKDYGEDRNAVISRAREAGVGVIAVGTDIDDSKKALALAEQYPDVVLGASAGFHPTEDPASFDRASLRGLAVNPGVVAVGECGLDYYRITNQESRIRQREIFEAAIDIANEAGKPLIIHCREAHDDLAETLNAKRSSLIPGRAGVMHFFGGVGAWEHLREYLDFGFYISLAGVVTFKNYSHAEEVKRLPLERMLIETDAPFVAPEPRRGQRNEPAFVIETAKKIAEIKNISVDEMADATARNTSTLFGI